MQLSGLDLTVFKAHSTRAASTSAAKRALVPIQDIIDKAGWSSAQTFAAFYKTEIVFPTVMQIHLLEQSYNSKIFVLCKITSVN